MAEPPVTPYIEDLDFTLYVGDAFETLRTFPDESVDCVVTSPPYWGLRDYSVEGQLGLEPTPDHYVARIVEVFREVRRVLARHGTCWVNLGDSYAADHAQKRTRTENYGIQQGIPGSRHRDFMGTPIGLKPKDLVGIPWRVAFALQADGWWLRAEIIWAKKNCMPESVTDRPTKAHDQVFLLTKAPKYYYDAEAIREPHHPDGRSVTEVVGRDGSIQHRNGERWPNTGRNSRSVWHIATQPFPEAHFATFPEELARRCILAGCPERVCRVCGKPSERIVELTPEYAAAVAHGNATRTTGTKTKEAADTFVHRNAGHLGSSMPNRGPGRSKQVATVGWSDCGHNQYRPGVVLDPFIGSGTTALVARNHGRHAIGIELSVEYAALAAKRTRQLSLLT